MHIHMPYMHIDRVVHEDLDLTVIKNKYFSLFVNSGRVGGGSRNRETRRYLILPPPSKQCAGKRWDEVLLCERKKTLHVGFD